MLNLFKRFSRALRPRRIQTTPAPTTLAGLPPDLLNMVMESVGDRQLVNFRPVLRERMPDMEKRMNARARAQIVNAIADPAIASMLQGMQVGVGEAMLILEPHGGLPLLAEFVAKVAGLTGFYNQFNATGTKIKYYEVVKAWRDVLYGPRTRAPSVKLKDLLTSFRNAKLEGKSPRGSEILLNMIWFLTVQDDKFARYIASLGAPEFLSNPLKPSDALAQMQDHIKRHL